LASSSPVCSYPIHLALFLLSALLGWRALVKGRFVHGLDAGTLCGLAYLARPEGLAVGLVVVLWLVVDLLSERISWGRFVAVGAGFASALLLLSTPYLVGMKQLQGSWVLSHKKRVIPVEWRLPLR